MGERTAGDAANHFSGYQFSVKVNVKKAIALRESLLHCQSLPISTALPATSQSTAVVVGCDSEALLKSRSHYFSDPPTHF
jgi:hypothetical protein